MNLSLTSIKKIKNSTKQKMFKILNNHEGMNNMTTYSTRHLLYLKTAISNETETYTIL